MSQRWNPCTTFTKFTQHAFQLTEGHRRGKAVLSELKHHYLQWHLTRVTEAPPPRWIPFALIFTSFRSSCFNHTASFLNRGRSHLHTVKPLKDIYAPYASRVLAHQLQSVASVDWSHWQPSVPVDQLAQNLNLHEMGNPSQSESFRRLRRLVTPERFAAEQHYVTFLIVSCSLA